MVLMRDLAVLQLCCVPGGVDVTRAAQQGEQGVRTLLTSRTWREGRRD